MKKRFSITAIIYDKRNRILSIGKNSYTKSHTYQAKLAKDVGSPEKIWLHAEVDSIIKCIDLTKAYKISVFRYNEAGLAVSAKPCKICQAAIAKTPIQIIEHT